MRAHFDCRDGAEQSRDSRAMLFVSGRVDDLRWQQELAERASEEGNTGLSSDCQLNSLLRIIQCMRKVAEPQTARRANWTYAEGGNGLDHPRVLGGGQSLVGGGDVAFLDATTRTEAALNVDLLGRHLDK